MLTDPTPGRAGPNRRSFLSGVGAVTVGLSARSYGRVIGANERVGVGFIGFGLIGKRHLLDFKAMTDVDPVAVAEVHAGRLDEGAATAGGACRKYGDFRRMLDDKDVDAVVVSTPDHWHALMTLLACAAGKDVYVEKPMSLFVREGRWMADAAAKHRRVVQVGTQQRSGPHYGRARDLIRGGGIGKIVSVRANSHRNIMPGFGSPPDGDPPPGLDYDLWLGPAPKRPYNPNRSIYHFRWFWDYSGGQMTNLAAHSIDVAQWILMHGVPRAVTSVGGRYALQDNGETPDTQDALFDYEDFSIAWSHREASRGPTLGHKLEFCGTAGTLAIDRKGFVLTPDARVDPDRVVPQFGGPHPIGGPSRSGDKPADPSRFWTEAVEDRTGDEFDQFRRHARNFIDCVKSRRLAVSDVMGGHHVATTCHLANISLRLGRSIRWDAARETIIGDPEAAAMLERPYRAPWDAVRRSVTA